MAIDNNKLQKILDDIPENPSWLNQYRLWNHSMSQLNIPDGPWCFRYLILSPEERAKIHVGSKAFLGNRVAEVLQNMFSDFLYTWNHITKVSKKTTVEKLSLDQNIEIQLEKFKNYLPNLAEDDLDQHEVNQEGFIDILTNGIKGMQEINLSSPVESEQGLRFKPDEQLMPTIGQTDFVDKNYVVELKCKTRRKGRVLKSTGKRNYSIVNIDKPQNEHIDQVLFYSHVLKKKPILLVVNENGYKIFNEENCEQLNKDNQKYVLRRIIQTAKRRERLMQRHVETRNFHEDIEPGFNHPFYWNFDGSDKHKREAMKLWNQ